MTGAAAVSDDGHSYAYFCGTKRGGALCFGRVRSNTIRRVAEPCPVGHEQAQFSTNDLRTVTFYCNQNVYKSASYVVHMALHHASVSKLPGDVRALSQHGQAMVVQLSPFNSDFYEYSNGHLAKLPQLGAYRQVSRKGRFVVYQLKVGYLVYDRVTAKTQEWTPQRPPSLPGEPGGPIGPH